MLRKWCVLLAATLFAAILVATLIPADLQLRTGLHWLTEHFLIYFVTTAILCCAWQRPLLVGGTMMLVSPFLEAMQGLTPDRVPDLQTAISGTAGAFGGALFIKAVIRLRGRRCPKQPERV